MTNFKLYFKLLKKHIPEGMIYLFFFIVLLVTNTFDIGEGTDYQYKVYIVGNKESIFCQGIKEAIEEKGKAKVLFLKYKDESKLVEEQEKRLQRLIDEAVLTDVAKCVLRISEGDMEFEKSGEVSSRKIELICNLEDKSVLEVQECIDAYLKSLENSDTYYSKSQFSNKPEIKGRINTVEENKNDRGVLLDKARQYMNVLIYGLSTFICVGVICVSSSINRPLIRERRCYAPIEANMEKDLLKCHFLFGAMALGVLFLPTFYFGGKAMLSTEGVLFGMNAMLVTANLVMLGYLGSLFVKSLSTEMIAVNVISLGSLFMSGILQEQWEISELAARIGAFFPTYWYVRANNLISHCGIDTSGNLKSIMSTMFIEGLFGIALYIVTLVARMQNLEEEEK